MSLSGHFNSKYMKDRKTGKDINTFEDFRSARIRHSDGSHGHYKAGKLIAKEDTPQDSKFHAPTPVVTIVAEPENKERVNRVKKNLDVNAPSMRL